MRSRTRVFIRADASAAGGLGHVMRTVAIAEAAQLQACHVTFVSSELGSRVLATRGLTSRSAETTADVAWLEDVRARDIVVFDGYDFSTETIGEAKAAAGAVGVVDDLGHGTFPADVLLNQSLSEGDYEVDADTELLIGPRHALIRAEFRRYRRMRTPTEPGGLLVTMGGSDVAGLTEPILDSLVGCTGFRRKVAVVGPAGPLPQPISEWDIIRSPRMPAAVFDRASVAISAAGSTAWELAFLGIPSALVAVADNQLSVVRSACQAGTAVDLGPARMAASAVAHAVVELADPVRHRQLSQAALDVVDGEGARRFIDALLRRVA